MFGIARPGNESRTFFRARENRRRCGMKYLFMDRDGVINKDPGGWTEHGYVTDWKDFHFLPGSLEALKILKEENIKVIIISNQGGVSRGLFTNDKLNEIDSLMIKRIQESGGDIKESFYCPHSSADNCSCRKPQPGLLEMAVKKYDIDPKKTFFIGDDKRDVIAGKSIGCKTALVLSGKSSNPDTLEWQDKPDYVFDNLLEAVKSLIKGEPI